ncbi:hypothetical protein LB543_05105 [Mesorhizobium sp. ESP7-2]|uniref:hypothetical protein n=1 Tax=Mesorhizobium sp. ESP7-2 TaxID=2876622 RepID=UPI001CCB4329|nr:hypothetical protein [Mesorhizobium sp. ESP7-2]MBZ9706097.1 hypothetical protein [Mesorhizobium sp. ESP7-2]
MFMTFNQPAKTALEASQEATILGAQMLLTFLELSTLDESTESRIVTDRLAHDMAYEMMKKEVVARALSQTEAPFNERAMSYRAEIVVVPRAAWKTMLNALAQIARKEATEAKL